MAEKYNTKADKDLVEEAQKRFDRCVEAEEDDRKAFVEDTDFYAGDQWPDTLTKAREKSKRPCLTINRMPQFVRQVTNDQRQNRPSIKIRPADDQADPETAEVMSGLVRHIESNSSADQAYDNAFFYAVAGGFGYFRVMTEYVNDKSFDQEIFIRRIANQLSVYRDPDSVEPDGSDYRFAFIVDDMPREEYERQYGKCTENEWSKAGVGNSSNSWVQKDHVRVAEYYYITYEEKTLFLLPGKLVVERLPEGVEALDTRKVLVPKVKWAKICGNTIKEKRDLPGKYIPLIPVYGDEIVIKGKRRLISLVRFAKDPQRMFNYWRSTEVELLSLQSKAPFVVAEGQLDGYEREWQEANVEPKPYLTYKPTSLNGQPVGAPQRQAFATSPTGVIHGALNAEGDMKSVTGIYDSSLGANGNETSGKAILARQKEGDTSTFHYIDNLTRSIRQCGRILVGYIPVVYDTPRMARILGLDGKESMVQVNQPFETTEKGKAIMRTHDLGLGTYDVVCAAGPSYTTQRQEAAEAMSQIIPTNPQLMAVAGDLFVKSMDWPGAEEIAERIKKSMDPKLTADDEEGEGPQLPPQVKQHMDMMEDAIAKREDAIKQLQGQMKQVVAEKEELAMQVKSKRSDYDLKTQSNELQLNLDHLNKEIKERELALRDKELELKGIEIELRSNELMMKQIDGAEKVTAIPAPVQETPTDNSNAIVEAVAQMTATVAQGNQIIAESLNRPKVPVRDPKTREILRVE